MEDWGLTPLRHEEIMNQICVMSGDVVLIGNVPFVCETWLCAHMVCLPGFHVLLWILCSGSRIPRLVKAPCMGPPSPRAPDTAGLG